MPAPGSPLHIQETKNVTVVTFRDRILLDTEELKIIEAELIELAKARPCCKLVVDFEDVQSLSSQMLGALLKVGDLLESLDGRLGLCNLNKNLRAAFEITKLKKVFAIYNNQQAAVQGVQ